MDLDIIRNEVENLENACDGFLTVKNMTDEELERQNIQPSLLDIKAFNSIVADCKEEVKNASIEKMVSVLKLLFNIETESFDIKNVSLNVDNFVNERLNSGVYAVGEKELNSMKIILKNMEDINKHLTQVQIGGKKNKKAISKNKELSALASKLNLLATDIKLQMEYDAKKIVNKIVDDFYNIYIFFSFIVYMTIAQEEELLSIEIANELDRFTKVIDCVFNGRALKNQDMLYYYAVHELSELKEAIYVHISQYDTDLA